MVEVRAVGESDFEAIYRELLCGLGPKIDKARWLQLFTYDWAGATRERGFALFRGDTPVGFLGTVTSNRKIGEAQQPVCNLSSWVVKDEFRRYSLRLLSRALSRKDNCFTNLSPVQPRIRTIFRRYKFSELESSLTLLLPVPSWRVVRRILISAVYDPARVRDLLSVSDRQIFDDHQLLTCRHAAFISGNSYCYLVWSNAIRRGLSFSIIHYLSNPELFAQCIDSIRLSLTRHTGNLFASIDSRFCGPVRLPMSVRYPFLMLYRSDSLEPEDLRDNLYTELALLGF